MSARHLLEESPSNGNSTGNSWPSLSSCRRWHRRPYCFRQQRSFRVINRTHLWTFIDRNRSARICCLSTIDRSLETSTTTMKMLNNPFTFLLSRLDSRSTFINWSKNCRSTLTTICEIFFVPKSRRSRVERRDEKPAAVLKVFPPIRIFTEQLKPQVLYHCLNGTATELELCPGRRRKILRSFSRRISSSSDSPLALRRCIMQSSRQFDVFVDSMRKRRYRTATVVMMRRQVRAIMITYELSLCMENEKFKIVHVRRLLLKFFCKNKCQKKSCDDSPTDHYVDSEDNYWRHHGRFSSLRYLKLMNHMNSSFLLEICRWNSSTDSTFRCHKQ